MIYKGKFQMEFILVFYSYDLDCGNVRLERIF